jgi:hypothetical protein
VFVNSCIFQFSLTKYPQPVKERPIKRHFSAVALPLAMVLAGIYLFLIILPSIESKAPEFDEHHKNAPCCKTLDRVIIYVVNLVQLLMIAMAMFLVFAAYGLFQCINIGYPLLFAVLFVSALFSFMFLLQTVFETSKTWFGIDHLVLTATWCVPLICLLPVFVFDHISQPSIKSWEISFPINAFLLGVDLFQDYLNAGMLNPTS